FPEVDREAKIILTRTPGIDTALALQIARMVASVRKEDLRKVPGVAETLDWAATLAGLDLHDLRQEPEAVHGTMLCLLKTREDRSRLTREVNEPALRSLFCATHSDWQRFDEIFDAFWRGRGVRQARTLAGTALQSRAAARHLEDVGPRAGTPALSDHVDRRHDEGRAAGDGRGK